MTEKEFIETVKNKHPKFQNYRHTYMAQTALELAKQHGAKFGPELVKPVNLPELAICGGHASFVVSSTNDYRLSAEEAQEVLRRCNLVPQLSDLIARRWGSLSGAELLQYLSGAAPVPNTDTNTYDSGWISNPDGSSFR